MRGYSNIIFPIGDVVLPCAISIKSGDAALLSPAADDGAGRAAYQLEELAVPDVLVDGSLVLADVPGQAPDPAARRHAAKGVRRLVERRAALLDRGAHKNKANVATARELACWAWTVGLMAEGA